MNKEHFFSLAEMNQPVNQWICIAFIGIFCFWTLLYYFTQKTQIIGESYAASTDYYLQNAEIQPQISHSTKAPAVKSSHGTIHQ